ncbi:hypothetical protein SmJEL517_g00459 [Synchytrium microbalum]|uniref:Uncharacterized protein n=1 Tax=Synchytrium microbalum TaxID=1806994 RepID=A0A507CIL5_9FUNG|nr:uncharacterized protein SmJEL517_g00459 [Synchytrium microbalum]TPX37565.1 hypothetical protein SmJEL517_g00459 [Synchytrium microbalum]
MTCFYYDPVLKVFSPCALRIFISVVLVVAFLIIVLVRNLTVERVDVVDEQEPLLADQTNYNSNSESNHASSGKEPIVYTPSASSLVSGATSISVLIIVTYLLDMTWILGLYVRVSNHSDQPVTWPTPPWYLVAGAITTLTVWCVHHYYLLYDWKHGSVWSARGRLVPISVSAIVFWIVAFAAGLVELYHDTVYLNHPDRWPEQSGAIGSGLSTIATSFIFAFAARMIMLLGLVIVAAITIALSSNSTQTTSTALNGHANGDAANGLAEEASEAPDSRHTTRSALLGFKPPSTLVEYSKQFLKLIPFLWPQGKDAGLLQLLLCLCSVILVLGRVVNLLVPMQFKHVVDLFGSAATGGAGFILRAQRDGTPIAIQTIEPGLPLYTAWGAIGLFVFLRLLQGGSGLLSCTEDMLFLPVSQFTTRQVMVKVFEHLHSLSMRFHLGRKTGEILRVQERGTSSIGSLIELILFHIVPTLADIAIATIYFTYQFDLIFGAIVLATMCAYITCTVVVTEWRTKYRRLTNLLDNEMEAKAVDSLLNFETVKYFCAESFEVDQYGTAIRAYQKADFVSSATLFLLNSLQNIIINAGLLVGSLLCARRIFVDGTMTVGDFVLYLTYLNQLYEPLNYLGSVYRMIQKNFVDMEKMLDLLHENVEVKDAPGALPLVVNRGEVVFDNVSFAYDPRMPTLKSVSFTIPPGNTVALVGSSGSGKSTILRLLFRFYDVQFGRILIDGQDIRTITQKSLRKSIGVVPQDTVLFNNTIRYNVRYSRQDATDVELEDAAKAAQIHEKIRTSFPDGYETKVGERGLRLSGGEKQRVAIARTILKNPPVIALDEATSSLDSHTERQIEESLHKMSKDRTTLIIAHRLSTIVNADIILVLKDGEIVERGSHATLMQDPNGLYYSLWMKQLDDEISRSKKARRLEEAQDRDGGGDDSVTGDTPGSSLF